jgi:hypothetical protein
VRPKTQESDSAEASAQRVPLKKQALIRVLNKFSIDMIRNIVANCRKRGFDLWPSRFGS